MNMQDFYTGHAFDAYEFFGAHTYFGGTHFAVWAPSAQHIAVETEAGWRTIPLAGAGVEDPREVSRLLERDGRIYVQRDGNGPLLEIGDSRGQPSADRPEIQGVPTLAIDGKYFTAASIAGSHEAALKVADQLIARARSEQGRK